MITATANLQSTISVTAQIKSIQVGTCADGTVENSDETVSVTVASGGTEEFPDTPISANSDLIINQPSGVAKDLVVRYETLGVAPTTIVGLDIVVPDSIPSIIPNLTNSLYLDGVNDTTTARFIPQIGESWSVSFWVKMENIARSNTFFSITDSLRDRPSFFLGYRQPISSIVVASWTTNWGAAGFAITPDTSWHQYTITYDFPSTTLKVYLDGVEEYSNNWTFNQAFTQFSIGYTQDFPFVGQNYGNIKTADLRIFEKALTPTEVIDVVNNDSTVDPIQRYILDDGIGVTSGFLTDYVSNQLMLLKNITSPFGTNADIPY